MRYDAALRPASDEAARQIRFDFCAAIHHKGRVEVAQQPEYLVLKITDLARGGAGVARDESGRVVFVPFTAPGDLVKVRVARAEKRYAQGELVEIVERSPVRQEAPCPAFGRCGGCQWQHLPYELQWETKHRGVEHALTRAGVPIPDMREQMPAERVWEYRNRVQLHGDGKALGFYATGTHLIVPVERCAIARTEINAAWVGTSAEGARLSRPYKVEVEVAPDGSVIKSWNAGHAAAGFRQVHDDQNEKLRAWVAKSVLPNRRLFDLYGGAGNLSLPLASIMTEVHCVDTHVRDEGELIPSNVRFHRSKVRQWLNKARADYPRAASTAILDPPRIGLGEDFQEIAAALEKLGTREIVAVGCDPDSWAKDLLKFVKRGWRLEKIATLDLFPQTPHVESLALLRLPIR